MSTQPALMEQNTVLIGEEQLTYLAPRHRRALRNILHSKLGKLSDFTKNAVEAEVKALLHLSRHRARGLNVLDMNTVTFDPNCPLFHEAMGVMRGIRAARLGAIAEPHSVTFRSKPGLHLKTGQKAKAEQDVQLWIVRLMGEVLSEEGFGDGNAGRRCPVCYHGNLHYISENDVSFNSFDYHLGNARARGIPSSLTEFHPAELLRLLGRPTTTTDAPVRHA